MMMIVTDGGGCDDDSDCWWWKCLTGGSKLPTSVFNSRQIQHSNDFLRWPREAPKIGQEIHSSFVPGRPIDLYVIQSPAF